MEQNETDGLTIGLIQHVAVMIQTRSGLDSVSSVARHAGVSNPIGLDADTKCTLQDEASFIEAACRELGDIDFALQVGLALHHGTTLPGYISEHSKTVRDALNDAIQYVPLVRPGMDFELIELGNVVSLRLNLSDPALTQFPRHIELIYAGVIGQIRSFTARPFHPELLSFCHDRNPISAEIRSALGANASFAAEHTEMLMDHRVLDREILGRDDGLRALLVEHGELLNEHAEQKGYSLPQRVELALHHALPGEMPDIESVASALGRSRRTLSRELQAAETRFSDIVSRVRITRASRELQETDRQVSDIGYRLGYASQAAFATAFRKATGLSPSAFRNLNKSN